LNPHRLLPDLRTSHLPAAPGHRHRDELS